MTEINSRDNVKHNERSDQLLLDRMMKVSCCRLMIYQVAIVVVVIRLEDRLLPNIEFTLWRFGVCKLPAAITLQ